MTQLHHCEFPVYTYCKINLVVSMQKETLPLAVEVSSATPVTQKLRIAECNKLNKHKAFVILHACFSWAHGLGRVGASSPSLPLLMTDVHLHAIC